MIAIPGKATAPTHVLWLTENHPPNPGGMSVSCDRIVRGLRKSGVIVDVIHFSRHATSMRRDNPSLNRTMVIPVGIDHPHTLHLLFNQLELDPQRLAWTHVVAFGGYLPLLAAPTFAAWMGLPLITLFRGNDFDTAIFSPQRRPLVDDAIRRSTCIGVVSRDKQRAITALFPSAQVVWTPNSIDLDDWQPLESDRQEALRWRAKTLAPSQRVLGVFGQIKPKKGGLLLIDSLAVSGFADQFHLLLVGDLDEAIHARLASPQSPIDHTAHPFTDRYALLREYGACDVVAVPSYYDGTPNVLLEAMGLGLPLLASTAGGMGDILEDGVHGFLFHPGDPQGCRHALTRLAAASDAQLRSMGEACLRTARLYTPERETAVYCEILDKAFSNPYFVREQTGVSV